MKLFISITAFLLISLSNATNYCESALDLASETLLSIESSLHVKNMERLVSSLVDIAYDVGNTNIYCNHIFIEAKRPTLAKPIDCDASLVALDKVVQPITRQEKANETEMIREVLGLMPILKENCKINVQWMDVEEDMFMETRERENFEEADDNAEHTEETLRS